MSTIKLDSAALVVEMPKPLGTYSRFRRAGDLIFISGISARLPDGSIDGVGKDESGVHRDAGIQMHRVLKNLGHVLEQTGLRLSNCIDITLYLTRQEDFSCCNDVYGSYFPEESPARTTVIVRGLPHKDMVVEVKAVAWTGRN